MKNLNIKSIVDLLESMGLNVKGNLSAENTEIFLFSTKVSDHDVTGGVKLEDILDDGIGLTVRFAICSEEDTFDPELGEDIVIGRLFKFNGNDALIAGEISINDSIKSVLSNKLSRLEDALNFRKTGVKSVKSLQTVIFKATSKKLDGLV